MRNDFLSYSRARRIGNCIGAVLGTLIVYVVLPWLITLAVCAAFTVSSAWAVFFLAFLAILIIRTMT